MNIAIGADHRGYEFKELLKKEFTSLGNEPIGWIDVGAHTKQRSDYPLYAIGVSENIINGTAQQGVLLCGSGVGMAIAANRFKGIYAALAWNAMIAKDAKEHDGANVLVIPADFINKDQLFEMVQQWLTAKFLAGRYEERLMMIDQRGNF